jgi:hypothetical protein
MISGRHNVTLQINLSPGDIAYAEMTVPPLVRSHRASVDATLAVVDCCKPQATRTIDRERAYPEPQFTRRVEQICAIAADLHAQGCFDRVVYLRPGDAVLRAVAKKYLRNLIAGTHDAKGTPILAYLAALEVTESRYVVHYDADMLLHQDPGYDWTVEAIERMSKLPRAVIATPRVSPPFAAYRNLPDATSLHEGPTPELVNGGWLVNWFSTRCFLMDRERLAGYLPLPRGRLLLELVARRILNRGYPLLLEIMLCRRIGDEGGRRLDLKSERAWILHPDDKGARFLQLLPAIQQAIAAGDIPLEQRGWENLKLPLWDEFLRQREGERAAATHEATQS